MEKRMPDEHVEFLIRGILTLQNPGECLLFFQDLCTPSELQEMAKRLQAARMLDTGRSYAEIAEATGLSTATISRVNRCMKNGGQGYSLLLSRTVHKR